MSTQSTAINRRLKAQEKAEAERAAAEAKKKADEEDAARKKAFEDEGDTTVAEAVPMA